MPTAPPMTLVTAEAFWQLPEHGLRSTLVRGELIETMPPGGNHGTLAVRVCMRLAQWAEAGLHGVVGVESGFILARSPDTVRAPDVFFIRTAHLPPTGIPEAFWEQAPDLAVEIVSPAETADEIREKVRDYLAAGTAVVWVFYAGTAEVLVHTPNDRITVLSGDAVLAEPTLLPGFQCSVRTLFG